MKYIITYSGAVEVEADSKQDAIDEAWSKHGIREEDIDDIKEEGEE